MASSNEIYKIRTTIFGHKQDIRSLTTTKCNLIVSGSRDSTCRIWSEKQSSIDYEQCLQLTGHKNFVSSVCVMEPNSVNVNGLVVTGSMDGIIRIYEIMNKDFLYELKGHTENVCSLMILPDGRLISGSWDKTARVWDCQQTTFILKDHAAAVWAVAFIDKSETFITASADKSIKIWKSSLCINTLTDHTDCVRGLAVRSEKEFLSCSNDSSIKLWNIDGTCLQTFYGHTNFVYSIKNISNNEFVSCGEDRTVKIWRDGNCIQTIVHPTESVWDVATLPNYDIVSGASDGIIRIFSKNTDRQAISDVQDAYNQSVSSVNIPAQIGDINTDQLPSKNVLLNPGKKDGQVIMVKDGNSVEAYSWATGEGQWSKIGNVVGGSGGNKSLYDGKEYDYVFNVDIQEGKPALKLPFNLTEDPWMAAHKFLERNDLSPMFLDQVANFILNNTKGAVIGQKKDNSIEDPFTGGGRYIPSENNDDSGVQLSVGVPKKKYSYFPVEVMLAFDTINIGPVFAKLEKFNEEIIDDTLKYSEAELKIIREIVDQKRTSVSEFDEEIIWKGLLWKPEFVWPCLDILRLLVHRFPKTFCKNMRLFSAIQPFTQLQNIPIQCHTFVIRIFSNCLCSPEGRTLLFSSIDDILENVCLLLKTGQKHVQVGVATLALNLVIAMKNKYYSNIEGLFHLLNFCCDYISDSDAKFRLAAAIGTLLYDCEDEVKTMAISLLFESKLKELLTKDGICDEKVVACVNNVIELISM